MLRSPGLLTRTGQTGPYSRRLDKGRLRVASTSPRAMDTATELLAPSQDVTRRNIQLMNADEFLFGAPTGPAKSLIVERFV